MVNFSLKSQKNITGFALLATAGQQLNRLKTALTERVSVSKRYKLQQLLHGEELGDRKPSQLLRCLQQLHTTSDSELLRELFLQRLPRSVQFSLLSPLTSQLDELALIANGCWSLSYVCPSPPPPPPPPRHTGNLLDPFRPQQSSQASRASIANTLCCNSTMQNLAPALRSVGSLAPQQRRETGSSATSSGACDWEHLKPSPLVD